MSRIVDPASAFMSKCRPENGQEHGLLPWRA
jgi:hypothetical protein